MKNSHICNPLTLQNAFVKVLQHKLGDPQSAQLGNATTFVKVLQHKLGDPQSAQLGNATTFVKVLQHKLGDPQSAQLGNATTFVNVLQRKLGDPQSAQLGNATTFVNVLQHKLGDPQSAQLGNATTGATAATTNRKITRCLFYAWCLEYERWQCVQTSQKMVTSKERPECIIIIMYIYHALINALSTHMIHINLNMIFYTHVEDSSTQTTHTKHHMERHPPPPPPAPIHMNKKPQSIQCVQHWSVSYIIQECERTRTHTHTKRLRLRLYYSNQNKCQICPVRFMFQIHSSVCHPQALSP